MDQCPRIREFARQVDALLEKMGRGVTLPSREAYLAELLARSNGHVKTLLGFLGGGQGKKENLFEGEPHP